MDASPAFGDGADPLETVAYLFDRVVNARTFHELNGRPSEHRSAEMLAYERIRGPLLDVVCKLNDKRFCKDTHIEELAALQLHDIRDQIAATCHPAH